MSAQTPVFVYVSSKASLDLGFTGCGERLPQLVVPTISCYHFAVRCGTIDLPNSQIAGGAAFGTLMFHDRRLTQTKAEKCKG